MTAELARMADAAREESARADISGYHDDQGAWIGVETVTEAGMLAELAELADRARHGDDRDAMVRRDHLIRYCRGSWRTPYRTLGEATGLSRAQLDRIVRSG